MARSAQGLERLLEAAERGQQGTTVTLHFNEEGKEYANSWKLREIIKKYSNHIAFPIFLTADKSEWDENEKKSISKRTTEQINSASALWKRPKSELKDEDYKELYKTISITGAAKVGERLRQIEANRRLAGVAVRAVGMRKESEIADHRLLPPIVAQPGDKKRHGNVGRRIGRRR